VEDTADDGEDWASVWVAGATMADRFAAYGILLVGKDEYHESGREEGVWWRR
jgi:hypothetical protein